MPRQLFQPDNDLRERDKLLVRLRIPTEGGEVEHFQGRDEEKDIENERGRKRKRDKGELGKISKERRSEDNRKRERGGWEG